jgi:valyl-tRNA synthetase
MFAPWPKPLGPDVRDFYSLDDCYLEFVNQKVEFVTAARNLRREANLPPSRKVGYVLCRPEGLPANDVEVLKVMLNAETLETVPTWDAAKGTLSCLTPLGQLYLPLAGLVDPAIERARLTKEMEKFQGEITKVEQKLANPSFVQKVPPTVLLEHQNRLADWRAKLAQTENALANLE